MRRQALLFSFVLGGLLLLCCSPARASFLELKLSLGAGGTQGLDEEQAGFSMDLSAGLALPLDKHDQVLAGLLLGGTFDFYQENSAWFVAGGKLSLFLIEDQALSLGYQAALVTDFDLVGMRNALRVALFYDIFSVEFQVDTMFASDQTFCILRGFVGLDLGAAFLLMAGIGMGSL